LAVGEIAFLFASWQPRQFAIAYFGWRVWPQNLSYRPWVRDST